MASVDDGRAALERFRDLIDAYGADASRWPPDRRDWALDVLARQPEARLLHAEAARLDRVLAEARPTPAPAHLVGRVLAAAPRGQSAAAATGRGWLRQAWRPALGLAFAATLGIALGLNVSPFAPNGVLVAESDGVSFNIALVDEADL